MQAAQRPFSANTSAEKATIEYQEKLSKHRFKLPLYDLVPKTEAAWIAPNCTLVGEVLIRRFATVWYNTVIRGDLNKVQIYSFSSIGDNCVIHTATSLPTGMPAEVIIGFNVQVQDNCTLYSCTVEDDVLIGAGSTILEGAKLEKGCQILPGSVVPPGRLIPAGQCWGGNPVEYVKDLNIAEKMSNYWRSYVYSQSGEYYKNEFLTW